MALSSDRLEHLAEVPVRPLDPERFEEVLGAEAYRQFMALRQEGARLLDGRVLWNVNSTAKGGGVAEMLASLLSYVAGEGVDARWLVIRGSPEFFRVTKRIHNVLHGQPGDGGALGDDERRTYEAGLSPNAEELARLVGPDDVVILHDPQTVGLAPALARAVSAVVWRCHIGIDEPNDLTRMGWEFLRPFLEPADAYVFSREAYTWDGLDEGKVATIPPSIDAFSPKNQEMEPAVVRAIVRAAGITEDSPEADPAFSRLDGSRSVVNDAARTSEEIPVVDGAPIVAQVCRWDRLKDPLGVLQGFAGHVAGAVTDAHLVLAGPEVEGVADDPDGAEVFEEVREVWQDLPEDIRGRTHLVCLPVEDVEENAAIVNALQRRAAVVVQKSLAEGFGLTVAEAMWKARPVVGTRVGGIQDQIVHEDSGLLVDDPHDLAEFGECIVGLLNDNERAAQMGERAKARVREEFLAPRHISQYVELLGKILS